MSDLDQQEITAQDEIPTPTKSKKRSEKQIQAFNKCIEARKKKLHEKRQVEEETEFQIQELKEQMREKIRNNKVKERKPTLNDDDNDESSEEEIILRPKPVVTKPEKKKRKKVIYISEPDEESSEEVIVKKKNNKANKQVTTENKNMPRLKFL